MTSTFLKRHLKALRLTTQVDTVRDGAELMAHLHEPGIILPHILFLDLNMPMKSGLEFLQEIKKSPFNVYYHAVKSYEGKEHTLHVVAAVLTEDPGNVHISFRSYEKPDVRKGAEADVAKAHKLLWAEGRQVEGEKRQTIQGIIAHMKGYR